MFGSRIPMVIDRLRNKALGQMHAPTRHSQHTILASASTFLSLLAKTS